MWYLAIILIVFIGLLLGCGNVVLSNKTAAENKISPPNGTVEIQTDTIQPLFSKTQIEEKLKLLAKTPPPTKLSFGAMCYEMSMPPDTISYICPACGQRTAYKSKYSNKLFSGIEEKYINTVEEKHIGVVRGGINACRREIQKVEGINISLDESEFCKHCLPYTTEPALWLLVNIGGESDTVKIRDISYLDIRLLQEFLSGSLVHKGAQDSETPLVKHIARIKELLGVKEAKHNNK